MKNKKKTVFERKKVSTLREKETKRTLQTQERNVR